MCQRSRGSVRLHLDVTSWVPLGSSAAPRVMLGMARQTPPWANSLPIAEARTTVHFWPLWAPQVQITALPLRTVTHLLPNILIVPSGSNVHLAVLYWHQNMSMTLPFTPELKWSSRHEPPSAVRAACGGSAHCSGELARQPPIVGTVPLRLLDPGSVAHRPDAGLASSPLLPCAHRWRVLPSQPASTSCLPLEAPLPAMVRQRPLARIVLSLATVQRSAAPEAQGSSSTWVPLAVRLPGSCRHLPANGRWIWPRPPVSGSVPPLFAAGLTTSLNVIASVEPRLPRSWIVTV